jgi:hypothetical protein
VDLGGQARFGPDLEFVEALDYTVDPARMSYFEDYVRRFWPGLPMGAVSPDYAGIRPKLHGPGEPQVDFVIDDSQRRWHTRRCLPRSRERSGRPDPDAADASPFAGYSFKLTACSFRLAVVSFFDSRLRDPMPGLYRLAVAPRCGPECGSAGQWQARGVPDPATALANLLGSYPRDPAVLGACIDVLVAAGGRLRHADPAVMAVIRDDLGD